MTAPQFLTTAAGAIALAAVVSAAPAQSVVSTGQSLVAARILPGAPASDGTRIAGIEMVVADGWKTYWRAPGEVGVPPRFDWSDSGNLEAAEVLWPAPAVFESFGYETVGYGGRLVLPVRLTAKHPGAPVAVDLALAVGVCREICVFEEMRLVADLPPGLDAESAAVAGALARVPGSDGLVEATCSIEGAGVERRLTARLVFDAPVIATHAVVEAPGEIWAHDVSLTATGAEAVVTATLGLPEAGTWVARDGLRFTLLGAGHAADVIGCSAPGG